MNILRPIMFVGTGSFVGKSVIAAGMCRILKQDGFTPAPFKGQNMSLNSYATPDGLEIGRAQAVQAEASGISPHTDMNPVLLKPTNDQSSQVVLNGKPAGNESAVQYFRSDNRAELLGHVLGAFHRLKSRYNPIVIEGAGSISELNLKERDITNMRIAVEADAATFLIADIDAGGVFGSVYGSIELLPPEERKQMKGIIINKFRGDVRLFEDGRKKLEKITGLPVVGVIPWYEDIIIDEEDSVALPQKKNKAESGRVNVAVILLNRMANFTDFNVLEQDERVHLYYTDQPEEIKQADIIIIPGSKNTISDLVDIRKKGIVDAILQAYRQDKKVVGICGGYQMMGRVIEDPDHIEGDMESMPGLSLLPVSTRLTKGKQTLQCRFRYRDYQNECTGYEIHMGETEISESDQGNTVNRIIDDDQKKTTRPEGYAINERCWGTYIHGILDNRVVIDDLLDDASISDHESFDYDDFKNRQYDKLADHLRAHLDLETIYKSLDE